MFPSSGGRRLVLLIRRAAAGAAGRTSPNQTNAHAARFIPHHYSSAPLASTADPDIAAYLVASCGLSPTAATAASRWVRIRSTAKADAVLALLRRHGFSDAHIAWLIPIIPHLLTLDPDKIIRPKLDFFAALGIRADVLSRSPILRRSVDKYIVPLIEFLRGVLGCDANIRAAASRNHSLFWYDLKSKMRPATEALRQYGLSENAISKVLAINSFTLTSTPYRIGEICKDLEALGLPITDTRFAYGFGATGGLSRESWLRKVALYQSFGVSKIELLEAFKKQPSIMKFSCENVKKKLLFFQDELKLESSDVMERPVLIGYSLEKSILPRCAVLSVLMREGKIERKIDLPKALQGSSKSFSDKYVLQYADNVPDVVRAYEGKIKFKGFRD